MGSLDRVLSDNKLAPRWASVIATTFQLKRELNGSLLLQKDSNVNVDSFFHVFIGCNVWNHTSVRDEFLAQEAGTLHRRASHSDQARWTPSPLP